MITTAIVIAIAIAFLLVSIQDYRKHSRQLRLFQKELQYVSTCYIQKINTERHHKYKRCISTAEWCDAMKFYFNETRFLDDHINERMAFYERWQKRWLKISEHYKSTR